MSSDGPLFLQAIAVSWESTVWALNNPIPQFLTCLGLGWGGWMRVGDRGGGGGWRLSSSNIPVVNLKLSHQIPSVGGPAQDALLG